MESLALDNPLDDLVLDRRSGVPLYTQISQQVRERIERGLLQPGFMLPTNRELVGRFDADYKTIHRAIADLAREGYVIRSRGKGTFVQQPPRRGTVGIFSPYEHVGANVAPSHNAALNGLCGRLAREEQNYRLYLSSGGNLNAAFDDLMSDIESGRLAALLLISYRPFIEPVVQLAEKRHIPVVTLSYADRGRIGMSARADTRQMVRDAAADLLKSGRRHIGVVYNVKSDALTSTDMVLRLLHDAGAVADPRWLAPNVATQGAGYDAAASLPLDEIDGLIVTDDIMAMGIEQFLLRHDVVVPDRLAVASEWSAISGVKFILPFIRYELSIDRVVDEAFKLIQQVQNGWRIEQPHRLVPFVRLD